MPSLVSTALLVAVLVLTVLGPPVQRTLTVLGIWRPVARTPLDVADLIRIAGAVHCEDLHHHATATSTRLALHGFDGPFVTHGIDVLDDPVRPSEAVYIYAVNHLPNPDHVVDRRLPKARSRIDVFHHVVGTNAAVHVHTVTHPLLRTPNDVFAVSPQRLLVTNDHHYREGPLRLLEDVSGAGWTNVVQTDLGDGVDATASVALDRFANANGLAHGATTDELVVSSCARGVVEIFALTLDGSLTHRGTIHADSVVNNPSYFSDPFGAVAGRPEDDRSGYVLPGVSHGYQTPHSSCDPAGTAGVTVYFAPRHAHANASAIQPPRLLFQDDGSRIRTASAAVLLAIDPALEAGRRRAWLYIAGFEATSIIAVKVDL